MAVIAISNQAWVIYVFSWSCILAFRSIILSNHALNSRLVYAHLAIIVAMIIWGSSFTYLKIAITAMHPMQVIFLRLLVGSLALLPFIFWLIKGVKYQTGDWKWLLAMALFEPCLYFVFEGMAMKYTSATQAGLVTSVLPLMIAAGAWFFLREKVALRQWLGFSLAVTGVIWVSAQSSVTTNAINPPLGNFLEFLAIISATGYTLLAKHLSHRYNPLFLTAMQTLLGMLFFLPLAALQPMPTSFHSEAISAIIYMGLVVSLGGYGLYNLALSQLSATAASTYINLIPIFSLIFAMLVLNEVLNFQQWLACGVIFIGIAISQTKATLVDKGIKT